MGQDLVMVVGGVLLLMCAVLAVAVVLLSRALAKAEWRHASQIDRLLVLQRSESLAEFTAASARLDKARLEEVRGIAPDPSVPRGVAAPKRQVFNQFARYRKPPQDKE